VSVSADRLLALLKTAAYAEVFSAPLESWQLRYALSNRPVEVSQLLTLWHQVRQDSSWLTALPHQRRSTQVSAEVYRDKWQAVQQAVWYLRWIPWIESIWVTGGLAMGNVREEDDIDFMFITQPGCLWTTRAAVSVLGMVLGKLRRRHHTASQLKNRWCCNVWLDATALHLPENQQNLYTARETVQARPVYQVHHGAAEKWLQQNQWVQAYTYPGFRTAQLRAARLMAKPPLITYLPVWSTKMKWLGQLLNPWLRQLQWRRMQGISHDEKVSTHAAFFHPTRRSPQILREYERILSVLRKKYHA